MSLSGMHWPITIYSNPPTIPVNYYNNPLLHNLKWPYSEADKHWDKLPNKNVYVPYKSWRNKIHTY